MGFLGHGSEKVSLSLLAFGALLFFVLEFGVFFFFYPGAGPIDGLVSAAPVLCGLFCHFAKVTTSFAGAHAADIGSPHFR